MLEKKGKEIEDNVGARVQTKEAAQQAVSAATTQVDKLKFVEGYAVIVALHEDKSPETEAVADEFFSLEV